MNESFTIKENIEMKNGSLLIHSHENKFVGEAYTKVYDKCGNLLYTKKDRNSLMLPGAIFILEQMFKTKASSRYLHPTSISTGIESIGTIELSSGWTEPPTVNSEYIFGFMAGNGGSSISGINDVNKSNTCLTNETNTYSFIPFRVVSTSDEQPSGYGFKTTHSGDNYYYVKNFSTNPSIAVETVNEKTVACASMGISIDENDFREYFANSDSNTPTVISQIGLVAGTYNSSTGACDDVKLITTLNFSPIALNSGTTFTMVYKIYCL